jgi:hypothetical protein
MLRSMKQGWATSAPKLKVQHDVLQDLSKLPEKDADESGEAVSADCQITVMSGSASREFPLGNQTVGTIRQLLKGILNIADHAVALVNGQEVAEEYVVKAHDRVEFVRRAGSKGASSSDDIIEIRGQSVALRRGPKVVMEVGLPEFIANLSQQESLATFPDGSPLPDGVRYLRHRGHATVVVLELSPQVRQVRWIAARSSQPFGAGARYEGITLAFPYIVIVVLFSNGCLSGYQQLFYRTEAIASERDALYLPNLLNVADGYGQKCWLCLANMEDVSRLPWNRKVQRVVEHVWEAGFNRSSEHHEGNSYWQQMSEANLDPRISSLESWEKATKADPFFMLDIKWRPAGLTVKQAVDAMLSVGYAPASINTSADLVTLICASGLPPTRSRLSPLHQALKALMEP